MVFPVVIMDVRVGLWRKLSAEELMLLKCVVGEDSWESLGPQGDPTSFFVKGISLEYSLEGLMLKLKLQYFGHLMGRTDSFEKTLMLAKIEGGRRKGRQMLRWLDGISDLMDISLSKLFAWHGKSTGVSALASFLPKKSQGWSPSEWTCWIFWVTTHKRKPILGLKGDIKKHKMWFLLS